MSPLSRLLLVAFVLGACASARAATHVVTTTDDTEDAAPGDGACADAQGWCSLRAATMEANAALGPDRVLVPAGLFALSRLAGFDVTDDLEIAGAGRDATVVEAEWATGVIDVVPGVSLTLSGLTVREAPGTTVLWGLRARSASVTLLDTGLELGDLALELLEGSRARLVGVRLVRGQTEATAGTVLEATGSVFEQRGLREWAGFSLGNARVVLEDSVVRDYGTALFKQEGLDCTVAASRCLLQEARKWVWCGLQVDLDECRLVGNAELEGDQGTVATLRNCDVRWNPGTDSGEYEGDTELWRVSDTSFVRNGTVDSKGLFFLYSDFDGRFERCLFLGNRSAATDEFSAPIFSSWEERARAAFDACTFAGNEGRCGVGNIQPCGYPRYTLVDFTNCTITGNRGADGPGALLLNRTSALVTLRSCTVAANSGTTGGAIVTDDSFNVQLGNTIVAGNSGTLGDDVVGSADSLGHVLVGDPSALTLAHSSPADQLGVDPLLGNLTQQAGALVMPLLPGSPALDSGPLTVSDTDPRAGPLRDERGAPRPQGAACDVGAWEACAGTTDSDRDGLPDACDPCPMLARSAGGDADGDGLGDACDPDDDDDGVPDAADDCPRAPDPDQEDVDGDTVGEACDTCPGLADPIQVDGDADTIGDACDDCTRPDPAQADRDGDTLPDACDLCPDSTQREFIDADGDRKGDSCDPCPAFGYERPLDSDGDRTPDDCDICPALADPTQGDSDGDGTGDACDDCPVVQDASQLDSDSDGQGDACDADDDGDGLADAADPCPLLPGPPQSDSDGDGAGDVCDNCPTVPNSSQADPDRDGLGSACDLCRDAADPAQADSDGDRIGDACDACPLVPDPGQQDADGDHVGDACDNCPSTRNGAWLAQADLDGDGQGDACDLDDDDDGVPDASDKCPRDADSTNADTDGDRLGDACDTCPTLADDHVDLDFDGVADACDPCPYAWHEELEPDTDRDGVHDPCDTCPLVPDAGQEDADGDTVGDACDDCPSWPDPLQRDADLDGVGDACQFQDFDRDGLAGAADNCPWVASANMSDSDGDGMGDACDATCDAEASALDRDPATFPLVVRHVGALLALTWEDAPGGAWTLQRGTLPGSGTLASRAPAYDHRPLPACGIAQPLALVADDAGSFYFLVARHCGVADGSLGRDSFGRERPPGAHPCP